MITTKTLEGSGQVPFTDEPKSIIGHEETTAGASMLPDDMARLMAERNKGGAAPTAPKGAKPGLPLCHVEGARLQLGELREWARARIKAINGQFKESGHRNAFLDLLDGLVCACDQKVFDGAKADSEWVAHVTLDWDQVSGRCDASWMLRAS